MKKILLAAAFVSICINSIAQDAWKITASNIDSKTYYGVTVANGMIGIVSSPEAFKVKDVVLAGAYDLYGRGRVSNFLKSFNLLNMYMEIDGKRLSNADATAMQQQLDMQHASFTTSFNYKDVATISYTYYALRQLPYSVLMDITITAKKDFNLGSASQMEAPDALKDVQNYYNEIDRPHTTISLLTSTAKSPTGKLLMCASNAFIFSETHGSEPRVIHEMWDNNMHLMKFAKKRKARRNLSLLHCWFVNNIGAS
jgi:protein-glucosylgalactosylhydroxylysine glucosidase